MQLELSSNEHNAGPNNDLSKRPSFDDDAYSFQDEDPSSLPSERLLPAETVQSNARRRDKLSAQKTLLKASAINLLWILTWYTFATFLSLYNKWMFSSDHYNFQYPLFVSSIHMVVQFIFAGLSLLLIPKLRPTNRPSFKDYVYKVFPCALATSLDIGLSNLSLKTITLSFYTMCKSSTLAFVLLFAFIFRLEKPNFKLVGIIVTIVSGVILMVSDETDFELVGFIAVMSASACGGLRWALTEVLLRRESLGLTNPFASIFFLAPAQAVVLLTLAAIVEGYPTIFGSIFFVTLEEGINTSMIILAGGTLAFFMITSEFFLIKRTSVVTLSVCGIFKEVATIFISSLVFGDRLTIINIIGLCITLFGIALYNWLKMKRAAEQARTQTAAVEEELYHGSFEVEEGTIRGRLAPPDHMYNMVAESTPMLMVDGAMTNYRDSEDSEDSKRQWNDQYELR
ncbi:triose-phosphate transporter family-domain-containing protein [Dichotomocladium elegans]|nr:triose-phosphate transporter family-domain-containing protein [Dichotomocladium elegans]